MANNIRIDRLAAEIANAVRGYTEDVSKAIAAEVNNTAKETLDEIKAHSPEQHGDYKKGWAITKEDSRGTTRRVVWNKKHYRLVHLLEKGHAKRNGGRVAGKPHVGPAEQKYIALLQDRIRQIIQNGG